MEYKFQPFHISGICVGVKVNGPSRESIEKGLKQFKMILKSSERIDEVKQRQRYVSPAEKRRAVKNKAKFLQSKRNNF